MNVWKNHFKFNNIPITYCPFGVNTDKFSPTQNTKENKKIFIYFKKRNPDELKFVKEFLSKRNIKYIEFKYGKYDEKYYINQLKKTKYGIWIGQHESQGFALLEALSMNVPLLVWSTKFLWQEYKSTKYNNIHIRQITNPYWDNTCGEFFFEKEDFEKTFNIFINKLNYYQPRKFILENLSFQICKQKFDKLLNNYFNLNLS